jgi:hypothetical protein
MVTAWRHAKRVVSPLKEIPEGAINSLGAAL